MHHGIYEIPPFVEKVTFRHSLRLFYCYCMLINNLEFQIYWELYSDHDNKWSHVFSNSKIEVALSSCFGKNYSLYLSRSWKSSEVKSDLRADQFKETNKAWDTSRLACDKNSIFFFHTGVPSPRGRVQIAYKCPTLLAPDLTVINSEFFLSRTVFWGPFKA